MAWASRPSRAWLGRLAQAERGLGASPKPSVAWTVLSKPECTVSPVRATCTGWKPVLQMHGQDCPCHAGASASR
ncbi:MAG: hypothetical protein NZ556_02680 [Fimbriimonadales bacterium]|nr:hypothetical protein [Fimbriimonadales bacterium]